MRYHKFLKEAVAKAKAEADDGVCACFEEGCSGRDRALTCLSLSFTISLPVLFIICFLVLAFASYYKGKAKKKEGPLLTV